VPCDFVRTWDEESYEMFQWQVRRMTLYRETGWGRGYELAGVVG